MTTEGILSGLLLGAIGVGCALVLLPFTSALLWAGILVFTTWPVFEWLRTHVRLGPIRLGAAGAAAVMVSLTAVIIVLPLALAAPGSAADVANLRAAVADALAAGLPPAPHWVADLPLVGGALADLWNRSAADISVIGAAFRPYAGMIAETGLRLVLGIANGVVLFLLALFVAFFFYLYGQPLAAVLTRLLTRVAGPRAVSLLGVTGATVRGVVYGILGTAIVQGLLTAVGLYATGVPHPVTLGALASFLAVLPVGAPLVWIPAALWLMGTGHLVAGVVLAVWGTVAISGSDNVIRPWFIARGAQLPYLLTVLGVLGGALAFGLLGVFLGPVLLGVGYTLVHEWAEAV